VRSEERLCDAAAALRAIAGKRALDETRLDQLFAESIVQQLVYRDRIVEAKTHRLLRQAAVARAAPTAPRAERLLALVVGSPLQARMRDAWDIAVRAQDDVRTNRPFDEGRGSYRPTGRSTMAGPALAAGAFGSTVNCRVAYWNHALPLLALTSGADHPQARRLLKVDRQRFSSCKSSWGDPRSNSSGACRGATFATPHGSDNKVPKVSWP
jgi:hypothetical protein